ncbi:MAG: carbohydrate ABC transporter permease [Chloroflexi bacterium]|nr:carbohydrate ABC transporter permease [Chloroflexota bacterium]
MTTITKQQESQPTRISRTQRTRVVKAVRSLLTHLFLLVGSFFFVAPLIFLVSTSLKASRQIAKFPPDLIPDPFIWANYSDVFIYAPFGTYLLNTIFIIIPTVFGAAITSSLAAYAFARLRAPGKNAIFMVLLSTMMLPGVVTLIPTYILYAKLGWVGSFKPLIVPVLFGNAFYIFLMRQFFTSLPRELEDAALIDGCNYLQIFWRIILPLAKPVMATVTIFAFMGAWNDYFGPLIYLAEKSQYTLSLGLQVFVQQHSTEWGLLMAASTMMVTPIILLFFFAQKQFVQGIMLTGMKG